MPNYLVIKEYDDGDHCETETWEAESLANLKKQLRDEMVGDYKKHGAIDDGGYCEYGIGNVPQILEGGDEEGLTRIYITQSRDEIDVDQWRSEVHDWEESESQKIRDKEERAEIKADLKEAHADLEAAKKRMQKAKTA